jgi:hypothetical protein
VCLASTSAPLDAPARAACDAPLPQIESIAWRRQFTGDPSWFLPSASFGGAVVDAAGGVHAVATFSYNLPIDPVPFFDVGVVRFTPTGDVAWFAVLDDPLFEGLTASGIALDPAGNAAVVADSRAALGNFAALGSLDATGALRWVRNLPDVVEPLVAVDPTGAVSVAMYGGSDEAPWRIDRYRPDGTLAWTRAFGTDASLEHRPVEIAAGADGSSFVAGSVRNGGTTAENYVVKYDAGGVRTWAVTTAVRALALLPDDAGGVYVGLQGGFRTLSLAAADGSVRWEHVESPTGGTHQMVTGPGGRIVVAGAAGDAALVVVYESDGTRVWSASWRNPGPYGTGVEGLTVDGAGGVGLAAATALDRTLLHTVLRYDPGGVLTGLASFESTLTDGLFPPVLGLDGAGGLVLAQDDAIEVPDQGFAGAIDVVAVSPTGVAATGVAKIKKRLKFGKVRASASARTRTLPIKNKSKTDPLMVCVDAAPAPFDGGGGVYVLAPKTKLGLVLRFDPTATGAASATLGVVTSDPARPTAAVTLSGAGR